MTCECESVLGAQVVHHHFARENWLSYPLATLISISLLWANFRERRLIQLVVRYAFQWCI